MGEIRFCADLLGFSGYGSLSAYTAHPALQMLENSVRRACIHRRFRTDTALEEKSHLDSVARSKRQTGLPKCLNQADMVRVHDCRIRSNELGNLILLSGSKDRSLEKPAVTNHTPSWTMWAVASRRTGDPGTHGRLTRSAKYKEQCERRAPNQKPHATTDMRNADSSAPPPPLPSMGNTHHAWNPPFLALRNDDQGYGEQTRV
ncbi:hypothetical protein BJV74DRAFT_911425 [Russula compacta]|nr:hypothetical protein BJV74DRAFT_911425 [Russula compacta]